MAVEQAEKEGVTLGTLPPWDTIASATSHRQKQDYDAPEDNSGFLCFAFTGVAGGERPGLCAVGTQRTVRPLRSKLRLPVAAPCA